MQYKIVFQPMGIAVSVEENTTVLQAAQDAGVGIPAYCGSQAICGKCRVRVIEDTFNSYGIQSKRNSLSPIQNIEKKFFTDKEVRENYRLACIARVVGDVVVDIPRETRISGEVILKTAKEIEFQLKPAIKTYFLELSKATLGNNTDDVTRIKEELTKRYSELNKELEIDFHVLKQVSPVLRENNWRINVSILYNQKIINIEPGNPGKKYGAAVDVGTTTIAAYLCDLDDGATKQSASMMNPQICFGDDVLTRVSYCNNEPGGVESLQKLLLDGLNELLEELAKKQDIVSDQIVEVVLVSNTVMEHIALGINPRYLGVSPFISTVAQPVDITARDLGLKMLPSGNIHYLPSEAGFIGADNVAVLIAEEPYLQDKMKLIIDIGTNSEICLGNKEKLYSTSCATGPALEGAQIKCGMRAAKGAIEAVKIHPVTLEPVIKIIGDRNTHVPIGICGSGILDAVSQMAAAGIIEPNGKFSKLISSDRVRCGEDGKKEYVLYFGENDHERDIVVSQQDVRAVQLAKAALYAGARILMNRCGIESLDEIVLAGAFGSYVDRVNALDLGLFPDCHLNNVKVVGNAAGLGARLALLNIDKRREAEDIAGKVEFVETAADPEYQMMFARAMAIPHGKDAFTINQPIKWECGGNDDRAMSEETLKLNTASFQDLAMMGKAIAWNRKAEGNDYLTFPLIQGIEAAAYGGKPRRVGKSYAFPEYADRTLEETDKEQSILGNPIIMCTLECISVYLEDKILLEVTGPFSILGALINPAKLYGYRKKNKELLMDVLTNIAYSLAEYTIEGVQRGVDIISFADPEGVMEIVGEEFYKEICGAVTYAYLKAVEPHLEGALVHICGKVSYSLRKAGYIISKAYRADETKEYMDVLLEYAKSKKIRFAGHSCIHNKHLVIPLIHKLDLTNNLKKD